MFCEKCGNKLRENAKFCSKCGNKIMPKSALEIPTEEKANDQKDTRFNVKGVLMVIVITLILVIGPTLGVLYYVRGSESSSNTKTVNEEETEEEQPASNVKHAEAEEPDAEPFVREEAYHELDTLLTGEESATNGEMSAEEMYQAASDMIGDRVGLVYGSYFWSFCKYEGNPAECFWGYGDMSIPYTCITEVSGDTVMTGGATIKVVNPWILEVFEQDSAEIVYVYSGEISAIDEYMRETGTPYIISDSDCVKIDDNMAFDSDVARLARNEIYARHGRKFKDPELQAFFNNREWYHGTIEPEDFSEDLLNEVEKYNVLLLSS